MAFIDIASVRISRFIENSFRTNNELSLISILQKEPDRARRLSLLISNMASYYSVKPWLLCSQTEDDKQNLRRLRVSTKSGKPDFFVATSNKGRFHDEYKFLESERANDSFKFDSSVKVNNPDLYRLIGSEALNDLSSFVGMNENWGENGPTDRGCHLLFGIALNHGADEKLLLALVPCLLKSVEIKNELK